MPAAYSAGILRVGLIPTMTMMVIWGLVLCNSESAFGSVRTFSIPASLNPATSVATTFSSFGSKAWTCTPFSGTHPTFFRPGKRVVISNMLGFVGQSSQVQPSLENTLSDRSIANEISSSSVAEKTYEILPASWAAFESRDTIIALWSLLSARAANLFSNAMILRWSASIFRCCALLIPSSNTNKNIVQTASKPMPTTTSQNATLWTAGEYFGRSKIIPTPTAMLESTATDSNVTWGQNGSKSPERNLLTYVSIAAMFGWIVVSCLAIGRLIESLFDLWNSRHDDEKC